MRNHVLQKATNVGSSFFLVKQNPQQLSKIPDGMDMPNRVKHLKTYKFDPPEPKP